MSTPVIIAGRYRVESLLGRGGMGVVYTVRDELNGERLALKRLQPEASQRMARLFELEYQTLASLDHPGIVRVFDYQRDSEGAFYTMELVQGCDLSQQAPMPWRTVCACLRDVAAVLALVHARRLVHRDLTPRNLLRTDSGSMKLIDFGSLAAFGETDDVVGTLQFMAPESLADQALDQRADLFSLGALGYWLLTGIHAFPARNISELEQAWQRAPAPPSALMSLLEDAETPPQQLEELIAQLLQVDPAARPGSTAELIDRLTALADLEPEPSSELASQAFVGRVQERERVRAAITPAKRRMGRAILFEGVSGAGHTRLLRELGVMARLSGVLVADADASAGTQPYGAALALLLRLLPVLDRTAPELALLARLSPALHGHVGGELPELNASEARVRYQNALHTMFLRASQPRAMVLLLDDLSAMDEESQALFAALAHNASRERLLLVATTKRHATAEPSGAMLSLRQVAVRIRLMPLSASETLELLRSLFGSVRYLERIAERLYRSSEGNPGHCIELARLLVERGVLHYREGTWVLPAELSSDELPRDRKLVHMARVDRMAHAARTLAAYLSVQPRDVLPFAHCRQLGALAGLDEVRTRSLLAQLVREGVLHEGGLGYRYADEELAHAMYSELSEAQRVRAHRLYGELLLAEATDPLAELRACPHFLRAGERAKGEWLALALARSKDVDFASVVRSAAPLFEEILSLLRGYRVDDYSLLEPLSALAAASFFADHRYATRYGEEAIAVLSRVLRVALTRRLRSVLGGKLALAIALAIAGVALFFRRKRAPNLVTAIMRLMAASACLSGTAAACIDPAAARRYAHAIEPLAALGPNHACGVGLRFAQAVALQVEDRPTEAREAFEALIARFESPVPIRDLPEDHRKPALGGCYFALGVNESFREGARVLEIADKLEQFGPLFAMQADYIRGTYHSGLGAHERAAHYRQRAEVHAVHLGSAWQVDTWAQADATKLGLRAFDVLIMKQASHELARFARQIPSLAVDERRARGTYLALRGRHREALALLEVEETPLAIIGWARARGTLAMVYNELGEHERALAVCSDALGRLRADDLEYTVLNLGVQIEGALAKVGLGRADEARAELDALIAHHAPKQSPLTLGLLHRARFRVALRERDYATANEQLTKLEGWYGSSGMPSLLEVARSLRRQLIRAQTPHAGEPGSGSTDMNDSTHVVARAELLLKREPGPKHVLSVARELSNADDGFLLLADGELLALGPAPANELLGWAEHELASANDHDAEIRTEEIDSELDPYKQLGGVRYFASPLWRDRELLGVLVLGFTGAPRVPDRRLLDLIALHLEQVSESKQA